METIESILSGECGLDKDRPIIAGISGGPDSLCLMETLRQAGYSIVAAHFDHQLRPESGDDARMVSQTAVRLGLECRIDGADVGAFAEREKLSIEEAARHLRYQFMFKLAREKNAQAVTVGHTADDQVETILMHFIRGSALNGLKGMPRRSIIKIFDHEIPVVRPLLHMRREDTVLYCQANGLHPHYDASNDSVDFLRNRIRHHLLPVLEGYNPKFREAVLRMSSSLKDDHGLLTEVLETAWGESVLEVREDSVAFDFIRLASHSPGLQRNLIKHAMQLISPAVDLTHAALERAAHMIKSSTRVDLIGGLRMFREDNRLYVCTMDAEMPFTALPQLTGIPSSLSVPVPGQVELPGGWLLTCERRTRIDLAREQAEQNEDPFQAWLDEKDPSVPILLRSRRPGDLFVPFGMEGHSQKLSDFFVNVKLPQRARENYPLLCAGDEIIWVPGYRPAESHRLTGSTKNVLHFFLSQFDR